MDDRAFEYDTAKRTKVNNLAVLRAVVAAYLAWLGFSLIRDCLRGASTLSPAFSWTAGLVFIAAALAFVYYTGSGTVNARLPCAAGTRQAFF